MPLLPHDEQDDRYLVMNMFSVGWGLQRTRMKTFNLLQTSHGEMPGDELLPRCAACNGRVFHAVHQQTRLWCKDGKYELSSDEYSAGVAANEGWVEVSVGMLVRQPPAGGGAAVVAQQPEGEGGVRVAKSFPEFKSVKTDEDGGVMSQFEVVIAAVETGFKIEGEGAYDAMYLWDKKARGKAWRGGAIPKKTMDTRFSGYMAGAYTRPLLS